MKHLSRRTFVGTLSGAAVALTGGFKRARADKAEFTLKFGNYQPLSHPNTIRSREASAAIAAESVGRIDLQVYPSAQLGSDTDMLSQLRSGAIDMMVLSPLTLATLVPVSQVSTVGFAFKDYDQVWAAMDGELGEFVREKIARTGLFAFDRIWDGGYRQITTGTVQIKSPDDLRGIKMRVPPAPMLTSMFQAFGSSPATVTMAEVYSALQTHIVDGQENPLVLIDTAKLYEVQKYCAITNHMWDGFWVLGNKARFSKMPEDVQELVSRNINKVAIQQREDVRNLNESLKVQLQQKGLQFSNVDSAAFRQKLRETKYYETWKTKLGADTWAQLEKYAGSIS